MPSLSEIRELLQTDTLPHLNYRGRSVPSLHDGVLDPSTTHVWSHLSLRGLLEELPHPVQELVRRINVTIYSNSSAGLNASVKQDPFLRAGQYSLAWTYFCVVLLAISLAVHMHHLWTDKIRRALHKEESQFALGKLSQAASPDDSYEMWNLQSAGSENRLFPYDQAQKEQENDPDSKLYVPIVNKMFALTRWIVYRPVRPFRIGKRTQPFPSMSVILLSLTALILVIVYSFLPQPLFYSSIAFGSPPLAIRAGMFSVATIPWIIAISMKANFISIMTGIGHERLNVLHRMLSYICLILALLHIIPFYITPIWTDGAERVFRAQGYFAGLSYPYTTGLAAFASLALLCLHSLPFLRSRMYEVFVIVHAPLSVVFLGFMFWHCNNYLNSWAFLWATVGIWTASILFRLYYQNWSYFWRASFLCGEESAIAMLPENAVKITIPSQMKWKPGQFVYLRMPGISFFENHPFTVASLCSEDFPSEYGETYRDMVLVFRPFSGFTRKVVEAYERNGPDRTYRAFLDGPYGGMQRELTSFDTVVLIAGGSGITAIVSHLLLLIKKMREGTAVTKQVHVIWALRRPEIAEWFKEELRICRQYAPADSVHCQFYITAAKRPGPSEDNRKSMDKPQKSPFLSGFNNRPPSYLHEKVDDAFQGIAAKRNSTLIREAAGGDLTKEKEFLAETEDEIRPMPRVYVSPVSQGKPESAFDFPPTRATSQQQSPISKPSSPKSSPNPLGLHPYSLPAFADSTMVTPEKTAPPPTQIPTRNFSRRNRPVTMKLTIPPSDPIPSSQPFDFGFPTTPTVVQKSLMRFAFMPGLSTNAGSKKGWNTEYGRPDIPYMLRQLRRTEFGRRNCVFVCGPASMRVDVQRCVAGLQAGIWQGDHQGKEPVDEIFMHTENYAI